MIRVEPDGESVIAGRGPAGATVELLRNGEVHARTAADATGLFAFVPPALPPGSHEVTLRTIAPDGLRQQSRESVTIVVAENRTSRPLVALTTPDKPTVVLSQPEAEPKVAQAPPAPEASASRQAGASPSSSAGAAAPGPRPEVDIAAVETEDGGRLYVSGRAAPGSTVRLYLNETFIAPGSVGGDGKVSFAIGRGMKPGDYRVRLDDIDPGSGKVLSRAEVSFNVPATAAASSPAGTDQAAAPTSAGAAPQAVAGRAAGRLPGFGRPAEERPSRLGGARLGGPGGGIRDHRHPRREHGHRVARRQPLADQPPHLRQRASLYRDLRGEPHADPESAQDLPWPGLRPAFRYRAESALSRYARVNSLRQSPICGRLQPSMDVRNVTGSRRALGKPCCAEAARPHRDVS